MNNSSNVIKNERITASTLRKIQNNLIKSVVSNNVDVILSKVVAAVKMGATEYTLYTIAVPLWDNRSTEELLNDYIGSEEVAEFRNREFDFRIEKRATNNTVNITPNQDTSFYKIVLTW